METMETVHMLTTVAHGLPLRLLRVITIRWEPSGSLNLIGYYIIADDRYVLYGDIHCNTHSLVCI